VAKAAPKTNVTVNPGDDDLVAHGKGRPTPSRREREAANRRPIVGNSPADKKAARARLNTDRERARVGMANGEERYLPAKDRGEQRRFIRDHIDARWNVGEVMMPVLVLFLIVGFVAAQSPIASYSLLFIWAFVLLFVLDCAVLWFMLRRRFAAVGQTFQRGNFLYILTRGWQLRFLRLPKPQVKRGQYPTL
jgi:Flp pilus assembly protein TadB